MQRLPRIRRAQSTVRIACILAFVVFLCGLAYSTPVVAADATSSPIMQHPAWKRLSAQTSTLSFAWTRRYLELQSIAQDADIYEQQVPYKLERLHSVTRTAQPKIVTLLLDLVPARANIQESNYIVSLLQEWHWRLEEPLNAIAPTVHALDQYLVLLSNLQEAVDELPNIVQQNPELEEACRDFIEVYTITHQRVKQLREAIRAVRATSLALVDQISSTIVEEEKRFLPMWIAYYTQPLTIAQGAFSRLYRDFLIMCSNWLYEPALDEDPSIVIVLNICIFIALWICHLYMRRLANAQHHHRSKTIFMFFSALCKVFYAQSLWRRLAFGCCILVVLNTLIDALPQFHINFPFVYIQQTVMAAGMALWARTSPEAPRLWEIILPILVGQLLLHGDASALLILLCMGGALLLPMVTIVVRGAAHTCALRFVWLAALCTGLILLMLGLGRLVTPLLLIVVSVAGSISMLHVVNGSAALRSYMLARAIFVPPFTIFICFIGIILVTACSGIKFMLGYWYTHPIPFLGMSVDFAEAILSMLFLLGLFFLSGFSRQFFESLARRQHILDASAVPVMQAVVNCTLWGILGLFIMYCMGVEASSLAFIGGGLTVGVGIAAKTILGNFFCGLVIIFSRMVRAGDLVEVNNTLGRILSVNMRATVIETIRSGIMLVPNEEMLNSRMTNWTLNHSHACEDVPVSVAPDSNVVAVLAAMEAAVIDTPKILADPPPKALFAGFGDNSIDCILRVWVSDVVNKASILSEARKSVCSLFKERNIVLASPHLDVTMTAQGQK